MNRKLKEKTSASRDATETECKLRLHALRRDKALRAIRKKEDVDLLTYELA